MPKQDHEVAEIIVAVKATQKEGITALDLANKLIEKGHTPRDAESAIRRALDTSAIEVGPKLRVYPSKVPA